MSHSSKLSPETKKLIVLSIPIIVSLVLVYWNITSLGLSQWDEDNYVSTAKWFLGRSDSWFQIYEPPVFPLLIASFFRLFGVYDYAAIATSATVAVATVALVEYIGYKEFGLEVAFAAPIFLCMSPLFILFSRLALPDIPVTFFLSAAVISAYWGIKSGKMRYLLVSGLFFALTVNTKYQGILSLFIPILYLPLFLHASGSPFMRNLLKHLRSVTIVYIIPIFSVFLWFLVIGIGEKIRGPGVGARVSIHKALSLSTLRLADWSTIMAGVRRFRTQVVALKNVPIIPLNEISYYLQILLTWVPVPLLVLGIVGMATKRVREDAEFFVAFWFVVLFLMLASLPFGFFRMGLMLLPPLSLLSALGLMRLSKFVAPKFPTVSPLRLCHNPKVVFFGILVLLVISSMVPVLNIVAMNRASYREAGQVLDKIAGNQTVLAESQTVIAFYHPVVFEYSNDPSMLRQYLANSSFLIVDFIADQRGLRPTITQLQDEGRIVPIEAIPNQLPDLIYLNDQFNYTQLNQESHYIIIYQVMNATST